METLKPTVDSVDLPTNYALLLLNIINVSSKRGAFLPEEFKPIGELYEYIKNNLKFESVSNNEENLTTIDE